MEDKNLLDLAKLYGFDQCFLVDASLCEDAPQGVCTLMLLLKAYGSWSSTKPGFVRISPYYATAQSAYHAALALKGHLEEDGEKAVHLPQVELKPLCMQLSPFAMGRNTLLYHRDYGSRFHLQLVGLFHFYPMEDKIRRTGPAPDMCRGCRKCANACPSHALDGKGFSRNLCIRQHMISGQIVPESIREWMEDRLIGCDICQEACPWNASHVIEEPKSNYTNYSLDRLLAEPKVSAKELGQNIGNNMAISNRLLAQACICAGNSRDKRYLPILQELSNHPSETVSAHASWAAEILTRETKNTSS